MASPCHSHCHCGARTVTDDGCMNWHGRALALHFTEFHISYRIILICCQPFLVSFVCLWGFLFVLFFKISSLYVAQGGLKLEILLPQPPDYSSRIKSVTIKLGLSAI
jgi:hypothetical protein